MPITQYTDGGGVTPTNTRRAYYTGTDTLYEGYALCYNFDAADQSAEGFTTGGNGTTISLADSIAPTAARRIQVEKPTISNCFHFAGVVSEKSNGVTGPGWVEICLPGSVCNIYAKKSADHVGDLATGQLLTFCTSTYEFGYTGLPGQGSAVVLGTVDRSTTAGLVQAQLMEGEPSGGVQIIGAAGTAVETTSVVSTGGALCIAPFGVTVLNSTGMTTCIDVTAALTCCLMASDAGYIGQRKVFRAEKSLTTAHFAVALSNAIELNCSVLKAKAAGSVTASFSLGTTGVIYSYWDGQSWAFTTNLSSIVVAS